MVIVPFLSAPIWLREQRGRKDDKNRAQGIPAANGVFWTQQGCRTGIGSSCACGNRSIDGGAREGLANFLLAEESGQWRLMGCRDAVLSGSGSC